MSKNIYIVMRKRFSPIAMTAEVPIKAYPTSKQANAECRRLASSPSTFRYDYWVTRAPLISDIE